MEPEEPDDVQRALDAAESGNAEHWPTVAAVLAAEVRRLYALLNEMAWGA
jgi:hypothetical protein